ncbi:futalosine hydrolase [Paenibacillus assamensis]|uniref:futalosine hydrolase n=1 Tax=Paenibacillus assamensis TaxID=311244 RepID=UPI000412F962|nr:futalosine hydrolase [Paenibacillus assamensis]
MIENSSSLISQSSEHKNTQHSAAYKRILIVTAVDVERDAVLRGLDGDSRFEVIAGGVGPASAAASTATKLALGNYDLVVSAGIAGGFAGRATVGTLVVASEIIAADLGAETAEGFRRVDELGFGSASVAVETELASRLTAALQAAAQTVALAPVLTLSTVTGTTETAAALAQRIPTAAAEAMEGYGVAVAAQQCGIPVLELRAISNPIGPRDRDAWRIGDALAALQAASSILKEVLR